MRLSPKNKIFPKEKTLHRHEAPCKFCTSTRVGAYGFVQHTRINTRERGTQAMQNLLFLYAIHWSFLKDAKIRIFYSSVPQKPCIPDIEGTHFNDDASAPKCLAFVAYSRNQSFISHLQVILAIMSYTLC